MYQAYFPNGTIDIEIAGHWCCHYCCVDIVHTLACLCSLRIKQQLPGTETPPPHHCCIVCRSSCCSKPLPATTFAHCVQIKLLQLLRLLGIGDKATSDNMSAVVASTLRRAAAGGSHTIGHAIVYEAVR